MVGVDVCHGPIGFGYGLAAFVGEARAMLAQRSPAGALPKVVRFDVVPFGAECVVVVYVMRVRLNGMPRSFTGHRSSSFLCYARRAGDLDPGALRRSRPLVRQSARTKQVAPSITSGCLPRPDPVSFAGYRIGSWCCGPRFRQAWKS